MPNAYLALKQKHQEEVNKFPVAFAFSRSQFAEAMAKLGLEEYETNKVYGIGSGGYIRRTDSAALHEMFGRHTDEMQAAIDGDLTGDGFIFDMFSYQLANHEYGYTWDVEPTLDALGLTLQEVNASFNLKRGLNKARKAYSEKESQ